MSVNSSKFGLNFNIIFSAIRTVATLLFFLFVSKIIVPSRGMDFSDEGHYLLSSDPSDSTDAWGWPYGWNLYFLYKISGFSISDFRTFGFVLLLFTNYRFSKKLFQTIEIVKTTQFSKLEAVFFQALITSSSLLFYAGFLRSPSYNWLNFIGLIVFLTGIFQLITYLSKPLLQINSTWIYKFEIAFGLFIVLPAKPSTVGFGIVTLFLVILVINNFKVALQISLQVILTIISIALLAIITKFWPLTVLDQFLQVLRMPPLVPNHTFLGASLDMAITPLKLLRSISLFPSTILLVSGVIIGLFSFLPKFKRFDRQLILIIVFWLTLFNLTIEFWRVRNFSVGIKRQQFWIENTLISKAFILLILIFLLYSFARVDRINFSSYSLKPFLTFSNLIYFNLIIALIAVGFGSSAGIIGKLTLGSSLLVSILATQIILLVKDSSLRISILFALNLFILFIVFIVFTGSYNNPYRSESLAKMTYPTKIGNHNSTILLDQKTANQIGNMRSAAFQSGFSKSTPTINIVYPSEVGMGYALGGRQSPTIHFIWFGYPDSFKQSEYLFARSAGRFNFKNSWILKSPNVKYKQESTSYINLMRVVQSKTMKKFPEEYTLVYKDSELELWKPELD
jgi:hypothetical protein